MSTGRPDGAQLRVVGLPVQQGSKGARGRLVGGKAVAELFDTNADTLKPWRRNVAGVAAAAAELRRRRGLDPLDGDLHCSIVFRFPMPKSRARSHFDRGWCWKRSAPDLDKLFRAVGDSLTDAKLIRDDARIVSLSAVKYETIHAHEVGCTIKIFALPEGSEPPDKPTKETTT